MSKKHSHRNPKIYAKKKKPEMRNYIEVNEEGFIEKVIGSWLDETFSTSDRRSKHSYSWKRKLQKDKNMRTVGHVKKFHMRYGNLILILLGLLGAVWLMYNPQVFVPMVESETYGIIGAFVMGLLYPAGITTPASIAGFLILSQSMNPIVLALVGSMGAMVTSFMIFYFIRNKLFEYLHAFTGKYMRSNMYIWRHRVNNHPHLKHLLPLFAGILVASPLPTEIAIGLFAALKFEMKKFLLYTFIFNVISIFVLSHLGSGL